VAEQQARADAAEERLHAAEAETAAAVTALEERVQAAEGSAAESARLAEERALELAQVTDSLREVQASLDAATAELSSLKDASVADAAHHAEVVNALRRELDAAQDLAQQQEATIAALRESASSSDSSASSHVTALEEQLAKAQLDLQLLRAEIAPVTARAMEEIQSMRQSMLVLQQEKEEAVAHEKEESRMQLLQRDSDARDLESRLQAEQDAHLALRSSADRTKALLVEQVERQNHELQQYALQVKQRDVQIQEREAYITAVSVRCNEAEARLREAEARLQEFDARVASDATDLEAAQAQYATVVQQYDAVVTSEKELTARVQELQTKTEQDAIESAEMADRVLRSQQELEAAQHAISALKLELAQAQSERADATAADQEHVRAAMQQHLSDMADLESRLRGEQDAHLALRSATEKKRQEHEKLVADLQVRAIAAEQRTNETVNEMGKVRASAEQQMLELRAAYDELQASLSESGSDPSAPLVAVATARVSSLLDEKAKLESDRRAQVVEVAKILAVCHQQKAELLQLGLLNKALLERVSSADPREVEQARAVVQTHLEQLGSVRDLEERLLTQEASHLAQLAQRDDQVIEATHLEQRLRQQIADDAADLAAAQEQYANVVAQYNSVVADEDALKANLDQVRSQMRALKLDADRSVKAAKGESKLMAVKLAQFMKKWDKEHELRTQLQMSAGLPIVSPEVSPVSSRSHSRSSSRASASPSPSPAGMLSPPLPSGSWDAATDPVKRESLRRASRNASMDSISSSGPMPRRINSPGLGAMLTALPAATSLPAMVAAAAAGPGSSFMPAFLRGGPQNGGIAAPQPKQP